MPLESEVDLPGQALLPGALPEPAAELVAFRRDLHMHPELGNQEFRTTAAIKERLERAGLEPRVLAVGTGLVCDIGESDGGTPMLALRADIDGLPIPDMKTECAYRSTVPDRAHACGHDVHTTVVLGAGLVLAELNRQGLLPRPVRLIFQPAEVLPGGAADAIDCGVLEGVGRMIAVHCDPRVDAGLIGLREAPSPPASTGWRSPSTAPPTTTARPQPDDRPRVHERRPVGRRVPARSAAASPRAGTGHQARCRARVRATPRTPTLPARRALAGPSAA
ncbi:N-acetyldiaminopimelate deacetylase [Streptomyces alboniger]